jgi:hypothetical protein
MAALDELLLALDSYMGTSGVPGTQGKKFLATKLAAVFNHKDSPFNMKKGGLMEALGKEVNKLVIKVSKLTNSKLLDDLFDEFQYLHTHVGHINIGFAGLATGSVALVTEMNNFAAKLKKFDLAKLISVSITGAMPALPTIPMGGFLKTFGKMFQHNFSSTFTLHDTNVKDAKGNYKQRQIRAIDVHLVKIKPGTFDDFFVQYQKRFSSTAHEQVLATPGPKGEKTRMVHAIDVNVIAVSDKILKSLNLNRKSNQDKSEEVGGFFSTIFKWIKNIALLIGSVFVLGKMKDFLKESAIGQYITNIFSDIFSGAKTKITSYLKTGDFGKTISSGISVISGIIKKSFKLIGAFYDANKTSLYENLKIIWNTVWNDILAPAGNNIKDFIKNTDWAGIAKKLGSFVFDDVLLPIFKSISGDFSKGDYLGAAGKTLITLIGAGMLPGLGALTGAFISLIPVIGGVTRSLAGLAFSPLGAALIALGASTGWLLNNIEELQTSLEEYRQDTLRRINSSKRQEDMLLRQDVDAAKERIDIEKNVAGDAPDIQAAKLKISSIEAQIRKMEVSKERYIRKENEDAEKEGWLKRSFNANWHQNNILQRVKDHSKMVESFLPELTAANNKLREVKSVKDASIQGGIVVEPHSKDQILMAKSGGVFDLALKDLIGKMEEEIQLLREGFTMLANATMTGSGHVANAVIATANTSSTPNAVGGSNPIHNLRDRHSSKIRR